MNIIEVDDYHKLLKRHMPIGVGTTAYCFLMPDNKVFKLFKKIYRESTLFQTNNMLQRLQDINTIQNDTYIGPDTVVLCNNEVIGYIYPLVEAKTFKRVNTNIKVIDILNNMDKLIEDTKDISDKGFYLVDMHYRNLLYDGSYYVIDLDKGHLVDYKAGLYKTNMHAIYDTIFSHIFDIKPWEMIRFNRSYLDDLYYRTNWEDRNDVYNTYEEMTRYVEQEEPTIKELRRIPHKKERDEYYH